MLNQATDVLSGQIPIISSPTIIIASTLISLLIGLGIFFMYKKFNTRVIYNQSFNSMLLLLTVLSSFMVLTITASPVVALILIAFALLFKSNNEIKNSTDFAYIMWCIFSGTAIGSKSYFIGILGSAVIALILFVFSIKISKDKSHILILQYSPKAEGEIKFILKKYKHIIKSISKNEERVEMTIEMPLNIENMSIINEFSEVEGIKDAVIVNKII